MKDSPSDSGPAELGEVAVVKNLLRLRFCIVCHEEMTDEICCTCEQPTVPRLRRS
jgi:hypothetical protein